MSKRIYIFSLAHTNIQLFPFNNAERTMRLFVPNNITGEKIKVKLINQFSETPVWVKNATIAMCNEKDVLITETIQPLTVGENTSFALVPGQEIWSDEIDMEIRPNIWLAISLYYPQDTKVTSGNFVGNFSRRSNKGDFTIEEILPCPDILTKLSHGLFPWDATSGITTVAAISAETHDEKRVVAVFGDSICQQGTWTTPFTARLFKAYPDQITLCNLGIGGNRLLHDSSGVFGEGYGKAGIKRYTDDLLQIEGLTHVIFALGTNDIGLPGKDGISDDELITVQEYKQAVQEIVENLKVLGVKVYAATLLPRTYIKPYNETREQLRIEINQFICQTDLFDAVLDFDKVVQSKDGIGMRKEYDQPDGLHPNLVGGKTIADSIDISLFR